MSVQIFKDQAYEERAENARLSASVGAISIGDLVKSTLGPKGMDKLLQSYSDLDKSLITNDGATILKSIPLNNPAAKILVNISKVQDDQIGDGTTSVVILTAELLREAEKLVNKKLHPQIIIEGYEMAKNICIEALFNASVDNKSNFELFRNDLFNIGRTTLSSKVLSQDKDLFAELSVKAILRLKGATDLNKIQIIKIIGGSLSQSYLDDGFILEKKFGTNQPKKVENAKILIANTSMDTDKVKIFGAKFLVDSTSKLADLEKAEKLKMKNKIEKIKAFGINVFINRQLIYDYPEQLFTDNKINSIEHADFDGVERLALVTGGEILSTFNDCNKVKLGHCDKVEEIMIGEKTYIKFSGVLVGEACTIILRGSSDQILDEAERSLHDALSVLSQTINNSRTCLGGGCAEMIMSKAVDQASTLQSGKTSLVLDAYSNALKQIPTILADNAGFDSSDLVPKLKSAIYNGMNDSGLDLNNGDVANMKELGVIESYKLKKIVVTSATETARALLRVDNIIRAKPRTSDRNNQ